ADVSRRWSCGVSTLWGGRHAASRAARGAGPDPTSRSMSAGVSSAFLQHIEPRAIRTHYGTILDVKEHPRMPERAASPVTGGGSIGHFNDLGRGRQDAAV